MKSARSFSLLLVWSSRHEFHRLQMPICLEPSLKLAIFIPSEVPTKLQTSFDRKSTLAIPLPAHNHNHVRIRRFQVVIHKQRLNKLKLIREAHILQPPKPTLKRAKRRLILQFHHLDRHQRTRLAVAVSDVKMLATGCLLYKPITSSGQDGVLAISQALYNNNSTITLPNTKSKHRHRGTVCESEATDSPETFLIQQAMRMICIKPSFSQGQGYYRRSLRLLAIVLKTGYRLLEKAVPCE